MMGDLTLEQVRAAGRFAWHQGGYVYMPATGFFILVPSEHYRGDIKEVKLANLIPSSPPWHHLPGCGCDFCRVDTESTPNPMAT